MFSCCIIGKVDFKELNDQAKLTMTNIENRFFFNLKDRIHKIVTKDNVTI